MPSFGVPPWLLAGIALGAALAALIAGAFLAGQRLFPSDRESRGGSRQRGEQIRREEIEYYLDAIAEPYRSDATVEGHDVAYFLSERNVAVTFDPRAFLSLRDTEVYAVLVEHEMPGVHLGNRLPFETPDLAPDSGSTDAGGPGAGGGPAFGEGDQRWDRQRRSVGGAGPQAEAAVPDAEAVSTSFAVLGLPPDASSEQVRAAYRARVKEVHPDHGGDETSFKRIQEAYATAKEHAD